MLQPKNIMNWKNLHVVYLTIWSRGSSKVVIRYITEYHIRISLCQTILENQAQFRWNKYVQFVIGIGYPWFNFSRQWIVSEIPTIVYNMYHCCSLFKIKIGVNNRYIDVMKSVYNGAITGKNNNWRRLRISNCWRFILRISYKSLFVCSNLGWIYKRNTRGSVLVYVICIWGHDLILK